MAFVKYQLTAPQIEDANGDTLVGGTITAYLWDTVTPTAMYTDSAGGGSATSFTLNTFGHPSASGSPVDIFLDTAITYKFIIRDSEGTQVGPTIGPVYPAGGTGQTAEFASLEEFRASSFSGSEAVILAANAGTTTGRMILKATGTSAGTPTLTGARFTALAAGEIINEGGYGFALAPQQFINPDMFYDGSGDYADAIEYMDTYADRERVACFFYSKQYTITRTVTRKTQSAWFGPAQQQNSNANNECIIYGTLANIGDGNPLIRCAPSAGTTHNQSISFANIAFESNKTVDPGSLSTATNDGVTLIDISNVKDGLTFVGCAFRNAWHGLRQVDQDPYLDKVTCDRCHFVQLYRAIDANPTAGLHLTNCFLYNCVDFIDSTTDVVLVQCSLNNSSFATERTSVSAATISMIGGWIEGGNRVMRYTKCLHMDNVKCSETFSASGSTKFIAEAVNDNTYFKLSGSRVPTNTRLVDLSGVTKNATWIEVTGAYDGTNFSDAADIATQLAAGLNYRGFGNINSGTWNVAENRYTRNIATDYTMVITDMDKILYHTSGSPRAWTIPANASVPFPLGTTITIINPSTGGVITLAITTDTMEWTNTTGTRTIAANTVAILRKVSATTWRLSSEGAGIT